MAVYKQTKQLGNSCKATLHTNAEMTTVLQQRGDHDHSNKADEIIRQKVRCSVRRKADENMGCRPSKMICQEISEYPEENIEQKDFYAMHQALYRHRRKRLPTLPTNIAELPESLNDMDSEITIGEHFLPHSDTESGIIIFSCSRNLTRAIS